MRVAIKVACVLAVVQLALVSGASSFNPPVASAADVAFAKRPGETAASIPSAESRALPLEPESLAFAGAVLVALGIGIRKHLEGRQLKRRRVPTP